MTTNKPWIRITVLPEIKLTEHIESMNKETREWTSQAARGECGWVCSDCCGSDRNGMPDECFHGHQRCTEIIKRDKLAAMREGNESL